MKSKSKKQRKLLLLLILLLGVTVGFALLSTTLVIKGTSRIKANTWNIHWDSSSIRLNNQGIATATGPAVSTVTTTNDTVAFEVNLELPGEFFEFTIDAVNEGSIDGIISAVSKNIYDKDDYDTNGDNATPLNPTDFTFTVVYDGNSENNINDEVTDGQAPAVGDFLRKSEGAGEEGRARVKVRVEFNSTATSVPAEDVTYMCVFKATYQQYKASYKPVQITIDTGADLNAGEAGLIVNFYAKEWDLVVSVDDVAYDSSTYVGNSGGEYDTWTNDNYTITGLSSGTHTVNFKGEVKTSTGVTRYVDQDITVTVE